MTKRTRDCSTDDERIPVPDLESRAGTGPTGKPHEDLMELAGLEPATSWVRFRHSLGPNLAWLSAF